MNIRHQWQKFCYLSITIIVLNGAIRNFKSLAGQWEKKKVGKKTSGSPSDTKCLNQTTSSILNWLFFKAVGHI